MSVETDLVAVLTGSPSATAAIVGDKVFPVEAEQSDKPPYVVYEVVSSVPVESPETGQETNETVIDVGCYGETYANAKQLAQAVRNDVIAGMDPCVIENTQDFRDPETRRKYTVLTFRIWHDE